MNRQGDTIDQTVGHLHGMDRERAELESFSGTDFLQIGVIKKSVFFEFVFDVGEGEFRAIDRNVQFTENPWQGADVVFMSMSENDAAYLMTIFEQIGDIGNDDVDAEQFGFGEHQAGVDDDDVIALADGHAVHAELAHAAQRNDM